MVDDCSYLSKQISFSCCSHTKIPDCYQTYIRPQCNVEQTLRVIKVLITLKSLEAANKK